MLLLGIPPVPEGSLQVLLQGLLLLGSHPLEAEPLGSPQEVHLEPLDSQQGELQGPLGSLQEVPLLGSRPEVLHSLQVLLQVPALGSLQVPDLGSPLQVPQGEGLPLGMLILGSLTSLL